jgi:hypothetical protein
MYKLKTNVIAMFCALFVIGCAQVRSISGGEKDTTPPVIIGTEPPTNTLRFSENGFTLSFDEYVQLRDLQKELLISPPLASPPEVKVRQRSVEVSWKDSLRPQTTYIFGFGNAIADVNESNILRDVTYVFSTGDQLDSLECAGTVREALSDKMMSGTKVLLFDSLSHVFSSEVQPAYFARTDEKGLFRFKYLREGSYLLCALSDENGNNHFELGESIDWMEGVQVKKDRDSLLYALNLSIPNDTLVRGFDYKVDSSGVVKWKVEKWMSDIRVRSLSGDSIVQWNTADSVFASVYKGCSKKADLEVSCGGRVVDTLMIESLRSGNERFRLNYTSLPKLRANDAVPVASPRPISGVDSTQIRCYVDSMEVMGTGLLHDAATCRLLFDKAPGSNCRVLLLPGAITDDCGAVNDTLKFSFAVYESKELGSLRFKAPSVVKNSPYVFQLLDRTKQVVFENKQVSETEWVIDQLVPGDYTAVLLEDTNGNGHFDPMTINPMQKTERNHVYQGNIQVRANWEVVIDWPAWKESN